MSKYSIKELWEERYGKQNEVYDYAGRKMLKSACGDPNSCFEPTIDHIRPRSNGGKDVKGNIVICNWETNAEKADAFPHWRANDHRFKAVRRKGERIVYDIVADG